MPFTNFDSVSYVKHMIAQGDANITKVNEGHGTNVPTYAELAEGLTLAKKLLDNAVKFHGAPRLIGQLHIIDPLVARLP